MRFGWEGVLVSVVRVTNEVRDSLRHPRSLLLSPAAGEARQHKDSRSGRSPASTDRFFFVMFNIFLPWNEIIMLTLLNVVVMLCSARARMLMEGLINMGYWQAEHLATFLPYLNTCITWESLELSV